MDAEVKNKFGQVTIFVIIALVIVAVIVLLFVILRDKEPTTGGQPETSPESFLDLCLKEDLQFEIADIMRHGGMKDPDFSFDFKFEEESAPDKIRWLCYTSDERAPCVNQDPAIFNTIENEIRNAIEDEVDSCFLELEKSLEKNGYIVEGKYSSGDFDISIGQSFVDILINGELILTKGGERVSHKDFKVKVPSRLYEILMFPVEGIIREDASNTLCNFDFENYRFDPDFDVQTTGIDGGGRIYTITHKKSNEMFRFATRACALSEAGD